MKRYCLIKRAMLLLMSLLVLFAWDGFSEARSAGLDPARPEHRDYFDKLLGQSVQIRTIDKRWFSGTLTAVDRDSLVLVSKDTVSTKINLNEIKTLKSRTVRSGESNIALNVGLAVGIALFLGCYVLPAIAFNGE